MRIPRLQLSTFLNSIRKALKMRTASDISHILQEHNQLRLIQMRTKWGDLNDNFIQSRLDRGGKLTIKDIDLKLDNIHTIVDAYPMSHHYKQMIEKHFPKTISGYKAYTLAKKESRESGKGGKIDIYKE